ncbi:MAG TPA: Hsp20/alpha crystallin family protein [Rectinemataceae bacterium]
MKSLTYYGSSPFDLLDRLFLEGTRLSPVSRIPAVDVRENDNDYEIEAELPGVSEKDIRVEVKDGVLSLNAERASERKAEKDKGNWIIREREASSYFRSFTLPEDVEADKIEASFKDGVLKLTLPRKPESAPRVVTVRSA